MREIIIGVLVLAIGGITTFAYKNPKSYSSLLAPSLFYIGTTGMFSYMSYLVGKNDFGPFYAYILIAYMTYILWLRALYSIHRLKD